MSTEPAASPPAAAGAAAAVPCGGGGRKSAARSVLIPVDGGQYDSRVFTWYMENARMQCDSVMFVHVLQHSAGSSIPDEERRAKRVRDLVFDRAKEAGLANFRFTELVGTDVKVCLVNYVNNHQVDQVVMNARGKTFNAGGQRPTGVGRVADFLLKHVSVPVQLVNPA